MHCISSHVLYILHAIQIDADLVLPTIRSATEKLLNLIALGKEDFNAVLENVVNTFEMKFRYFVKNITGMDELFEVSFSPLASTGKPLSRFAQLRHFIYSLVSGCNSGNWFAGVVLGLSMVTAFVLQELVLTNGLSTCMVVRAFNCKLGVACS